MKINKKDLIENKLKKFITMILLEKSGVEPIDAFKYKGYYKE